ncbi:MAG TPA: polymer-forming cytoskeletal protein [Clostridia bacterium]|nr:polymer-forming cytoskeletal protein [Clostridia bacterium]
MWKPANATPNTPAAEPQRPSATPQRPAPSTSNSSVMEPASAPRNATLNNTEQATIGKSLVIKGEVTGSEALYIDGRVEGSISLAGNRVTVGRNGVVSANISAREIVVLGKVRGNLVASDRVDIRNEGSLTGDVIAQRISIEDGAFFKGGIDIRKPGQKMEASSESAGKEKEKESTAARA